MYSKIFFYKHVYKKKYKVFLKSFIKKLFMNIFLLKIKKISLKYFIKIIFE